MKRHFLVVLAVPSWGSSSLTTSVEFLVAADVPGVVELGISLYHVGRAQCFQVGLIFQHQAHVAEI